MSPAQGDGGGPRPRSPAALAVIALLAALWFALVFFVAGPALVLWATGEVPQLALGPVPVLGATMIVVAAAALVPPTLDFVRRGSGTQAPFEPPRRFVEAGAYRYVRNPMYLLYGAIVVGEALLLRSWALAAYALAFALLAHVYVVGSEEPRLRRRFGPDFDGYCRRVPRWIPRRPRD